MGVHLPKTLLGRLSVRSLLKLLTGVSVVALMAGVAHAAPSGGTVVQSSDASANTIGGTATDVIVTQGSDRIAIDWQNFSIANGESIVFNQPDNQSIALNRVVGNMGVIPQSVIDGVLQSNGQVWLLNSAGIAFGANANVDVGGLLATTADMDPATFIGLDPTTDTFTFAGGAAQITNAGDLDAQGLLALVAPMVTNSGDLTSSHGDVLLGGAEAFRLKFVSTARNNGAAFDELLVTDFIIDTGSSTAAAGSDIVHQTSTGTAIGGRVIADASRVGGGAFLNMEGLVEAQNVGALSGDVFLLGGVDITAGALGATATDAVKTDNMTIVAPGTATARGTAITIGTNGGPASSGGGGSSTANVALTATTGDITSNGGFTATTGTVSITASNGDVDVGDLLAAGAITVTAQDIDLVGANRSVNSTGGAVSLTANGGGVSNISSGGVVDIDGDSVVLSGQLVGTNIDIDADNGGVTANAVIATAGSVSVDATGAVDVDDVSAATTARVVSSTSEVDVGNVSGATGITISGTDVDLTGAGGVLNSSGGDVSVTASGGGANNISSAALMSIAGDSVTLSGTLTGPILSINADNGGVTANNVTASAGSVSIDATGAIDVDDVSATTTARVVSSAGEVDVGNVSGAAGVTISGTDVDLTGAGGLVQSTGSTVSLSATGGASTDDISAAGAIDIDGDAIVLSGPLVGGGAVSLTADVGNISSAGVLDVSGGSIAMNGPVNGATGVDLDAGTGGITSTGGPISTTAGSVDLAALNGAISVAGVTSPGDLTLRGASVTYSGTLSAQGQVLLEALTGNLTGTGSSAVTAPNGGLVARAVGGAATLNSVTTGGNLVAIGGGVMMTGSSMIGGTTTLQALTGNVQVAGDLMSAGGILLIEAPSGAAIINSIASSSDVSLVVLDLDLTGTISAGDQFNLTPAGTGRTIVLGGSGGSDGAVFRRPQGFTLDGSEITRISAKRLQFNAGNNDLALLDATFDPALLQSLVLGTDSNGRILAAGDVRGLPSLQLGFVDGATQARPELIFVSGSLGEDTATGRIGNLRLESNGDIIIGTQAFFEAYEKAGGNLDLATLAEPNLGTFGGTAGHVFIAVDQLRLLSPKEIVQLNTGSGSEGAGVVFGEAVAGEATIESANGGPDRVNLFGVVINSAGERITSFEAGLEPRLLDAGLAQNGELRLNLCVIGDSSSCSIAILREAQESSRSRNSALSSLTSATLFGFEGNDFDDDDEEEDLGGVAGAGNEGLWGIGLP